METQSVKIQKHSALMHNLAVKWKARAEALKLKPGTKRFADAQTHWFIGAMIALEITNSDFKIAKMVYMLLAIGRDTAKEWIIPGQPDVIDMKDAVES